MDTKDDLSDQAGWSQPAAAAASSNFGRRQGLNSLTVVQLCAELARELERTSSNPLSVLEAGGGSATFLRGFDREFAFTTIDISQEQLDRNSYAVEKILGDIQAFDYGNRRFDIVMCWDVLEHLAAPESALERMASAIPAGGILVVKGPIPTFLRTVHAVVIPCPACPLLQANSGQTRCRKAWLRPFSFGTPAGIRP
jgi:2-polyprenyl-3-methyl-5-hydroxy-6-metoxy-1,4-benzoquinol methylase